MIRFGRCEAIPLRAIRQMTPAKGCSPPTPLLSPFSSYLIAFLRSDPFGFAAELIRTMHVYALE
jgi:hypothetical protein